MAIGSVCDSPPAGPSGHGAATGRARLVSSRDLLRRLARYAGVSVVSSCVSLAVLTVLVGTDALSAGWANVIATGVGTVPSFELNRRWVWRRHHRRSIRSEVLPFSALSFLGLALSTLTVGAATGWASSSGVGPAGRAVVADATSVATFAALWVAQYLLLDRLLFAVRDDGAMNEPCRVRSVGRG